ncbi:cysteine rich repeat-containing protein [Methylobacterium nodulans]|uniref:Cysteine rich repeat protein n=1 Tax=Methylobacterium nodulans (strain LMG 21967 / CNCM I-2342 / ORS 2060) TaxID=460265 RepID=B8IG39_METNO|nr:cysteine rich repeat-containing protein [Methylobacterium nodulans]ACL61516.1 conserved hypothetical protein [Methylobacterium nodulans ORS 2060]
MGRVIIVACFAILVTLAATRSYAQGADSQQACQPDAARLCSAAGSDPQRVEACLRKNRKSLSAACRAAMGGRKGKATRSQ